MLHETTIEKLISEAIERGEFEGLRGSGRPLDLDEYFNTPEDLRTAYSLLKANQFVPREVDLLREIAELRDRPRRADAGLRAGLRRSLNERELALRQEIERRRR
ncbi:MAG: DUF1992 domain-containing protein [Pyrinomonadaceae bacterium]